MSGGQNLMDVDNEDQRFYIVQRKDAGCISRVGSVSIVMWYATRLMENPALEAEKTAVIIGEALALAVLTGEAGLESWAAWLIANLGYIAEIGVFASYMEFKDDWTQKVIFLCLCRYFVPNF